MKIAIAGIRGIPANFGGSETAVEEIGERLVALGHEVTVYCRKHNSGTSSREYKGMRRIVLPSINTLSLDMPSHTFLSLWHMVLRERFDIIHFHGVGNALFFPLFRLLSRAKMLVVVDGPDWNRPKWGMAARLALRASFPLAVRFADAIISDNKPVQAMFRDHYNRETDYVVYGANMSTVRDSGELARHGLEYGKYFIQVGALVPDKGTHLSVQAYEQLETDMPLVIVGDTLYALEYKNRVMATRDKRIKFLGYIYGEPCRELVQNAYAYIHPLIVDGTSPALLQAMALSKCVISTDLPETMEVVSGAAIAFKSEDAADLQAKLRQALDQPEKVTELGLLARNRIEEKYNWDIVGRQYEALSLKLLGQPYDADLFCDDSYSKSGSE